MLYFQHSFSSPQQISRFYAKIAIRALYDEVALYPKPGLVSFIDKGAHHDMDGSLFFRSLFSLRHYFFQVGLHAALGHKPHQLVPLGLKAEQTMYRITGGVNTHRGAIFALGILCSTLCRLSTQQTIIFINDIEQAIINFWSHYLLNHHQNKNTHGSLVSQKYAVQDAKQMAIEGYALVFATYKELAEKKDDKLFFGLLAYQRLLLGMDDINVLYRVGPDGLEFAREQISKSISIHNREGSIQSAINLHLLFSQKNISPGGVADMLGLIYFLRHVFSREAK
ncbi:TPA: triphosphoribosyl-dephospho-CoA synthase [Legionella pneumophila]